MVSVFCIDICILHNNGHFECDTMKIRSYGILFYIGLRELNGMVRLRCHRFVIETTWFWWILNYCIKRFYIIISFTTASLPRKTLTTCWRQTTTFKQADFMASEHLMLMDHLMAYHVLLCWEQWLVVLQARNTLCIGYIQYLCMPQW